MSLERTYIIVEWFYVSFTLCLVLNRLYVRAIHRARRRGISNWSDALVVVAWIFVLFQNTCDTTMYAMGVMVDIEDLEPGTRDADVLNKILYVEDLIYYIPLYCIKGAILFFLLEITPDTLVYIRRALWIGVGFVGVGFLYNMGVFSIYCPGGSEYWHPFVGLNCDAIETAVTPAVVWHMFTDLYIYIIPFFLVHEMKMVSLSQKLAAGVMFGAGFLLVGIAFIQVGYFSDSLGGFSNLSFMFSFYWSIHEQNLAVTIACLPALRATMRRWYNERQKGPKRRSTVLLRLQRGELSTKEVLSNARLGRDGKGKEISTNVDSSFGTTVGSDTVNGDHHV